MKITKQSPRQSVVLCESIRVRATGYNVLHLIGSINESKDRLHITVSRSELEALIKCLDDHEKWLKDNYDFKVV